MRRPSTLWLGVMAAGLAGVGAISLALRRARSARALHGQVAVICGGSRGLGRALARELGQRGAHVAICGRDPEYLHATRAWLEDAGVSVFASECDLRDELATRAFFRRVEHQLGPIGIVVANAATIDVAPIDALTPADFDATMREIFGSAVRATLSVLPEMRARHHGSITFIASIGGRVGIPHLAAYSAAKFAEVGFAEALHAEVAKDGIHVLTVMPGLMRTGSHLHATFRGQPERELAWFGAAAIAPVISIDADRAARRIADAMARRQRFLVLTPTALLGVWLHDAAPRLWSALSSFAGRLLPSSEVGEERPEPREGTELAATASSPWLKMIATRSARIAARHGQSLLARAPKA